VARKNIEAAVSLGRQKGLIHALSLEKHRKNARPQKTLVVITLDSLHTMGRDIYIVFLCKTPQFTPSEAANSKTARRSVIPQYPQPYSQRYPQIKACVDVPLPALPKALLRSQKQQRPGAIQPRGVAAR